MKKMNDLRVLVYSTYDAAGQGYLLAKALREHMGYEAKNVITMQTYLNYPADWHLGNNVQPAEVLDYAKGCDFFVFQEWMPNIKELAPLFGLIRPNNSCIHSLGSMTRRGIDDMCMKQLRRGLAVSSPISDCTIAPGLMGTAPFENIMLDLEGIEAVLGTKETWKPGDGKIRICHASTNDATKGTPLVASVKKLVKDQDVIWTTIQGKSWEDALRIKASCDILLDSMGTDEVYGLSCLESLIMRQRVIGGINPWAYALHPELPMLSCHRLMTGEATIEKSVAAMVKQAIKDVREGWCETTGGSGWSKLWAEELFDPKQVVQSWVHWMNWVMNR
jgi:hypothetical protein